MVHGKYVLVSATLLTMLITIPGFAADAPEQLIDAVKRRDQAAIRAQLQRRVDVRAATTDGTTALHWAAHNGDLQTLTALIAAGAPVGVRNRYDISPLWLAATNGHADVVHALLTAGADPKTTRGESRETVLMAAARAGQVAVMQRLLVAGADPNAVDAFRQQTALMWAAGERHKAAARLLVTSGARLEARSQTGLTPLMFAIRAGDIDGTKELLDLGADLKATAPDGTSTLVLAIINAHWELAATLLERGADPNGRDPRGRPLHVLAFMRRAQNRSLSAWLPRRPTGKLDSIGLAKALLARGASIDDRLDYKNAAYLPTHMALPPVQLTTYVGATPLYIAAKACDVELVTFLAANGANPTLATVQHVTPLLAAAGIGHTSGESPETPQEALETVKLLATVGNDINAVTDMRGPDGSPLTNGWNGAGALHGSVLRGAPELARWLIAQGVTIDRQTTSGVTALDMARGTTLGINLHFQPEVAEVIEAGMRAQGLTVPEHRNREYDQLNDRPLPQK